MRPIRNKSSNALGHAAKRRLNFTVMRQASAASRDRKFRRRDMAHHLKLTLKSLRLSKAGLVRSCILLSFVCCVCVTAAAQTTDNVELLSVNGTGDHAGNGRSVSPKSSMD